MKKNIADYLFLYLGCDVKIIGQPDAILGAVGINDGERIVVRWPNDNEWSYADTKEITPVLRPLSDMTEEETKELQSICGLENEDMEFVKEFENRFFDGSGKSFGSAHLTNIRQWADGVHLLLSRGFDLFGLIDAGLAIDKSSTL
jgi:hypothetical protein